MSKYVNHLRAMYLVHQMNHWKVQGDTFYGNHLLFERLYNEVQELADEAAERCIGVYGDLDEGDLSEILEKYKVDSDDPEDYVKSSLECEKDFQDLAKDTYEELKDNSTLTLGIDDMIMAQCSKSEVNCYLLQQVLKD